MLLVRFLLCTAFGDQVVVARVVVEAVLVRLPLVESQVWSYLGGFFVWGLVGEGWGWGGWGVLSLVVDGLCFCDV